MPRRWTGRRALGPYPHGDRFRVVICEAPGERGHRTFASRQEAKDYKDEFNERNAIVGRTVAEALAKYERHYLVGRGNKPRSWADSKWRIEKLIVNMDLELDAITPRRAQAMYQALVDYQITAKDGTVKGTLAADSHRGYLTHTKTFFAWCVKQRWLEANPFEHVEPQGRKRKGKPQLRRDELRVWLRTAYDLARAGDYRALAASMAFMLGMRPVEIVTRLVRDVDDNATVVWVEGKTDAGRRLLQVPDDEMRDLLRRHVRGRGAGEPLFAWKEGERLHAYHPRNINEWVQDICTAAGVKVVVGYSMRGAHSSTAVEEGASSHAVARAMGHTSYETTAGHYVSGEAKEAAGAKRVLGVIRGGKR